MKNITRLFVTATIVNLVATGANAVPADLSAALPQQVSIFHRGRLVCDQNCRCWHTGYRQRRHDSQPTDSQDPNYCPGGGHYNGYYRSGPNVGLGFEGRFPARSFPF